jgi:purine-binding chemotaxis protein CheW
LHIIMADLDAWLFCLRLLGARYAFEAQLVSEVVRMGPLTRLPSAPAFLPGVFTHRGEVVPVLDVQQLMGQGAVAMTPNTRAAITQCGEWKVAVVAEAIEGLVCVPTAHLDPAPGSAKGVAEFLANVARDPKGEIAVLDLNRLVEVARARSVPA